MVADTKADAVRESPVASWDGEALLKTARINGKEIFLTTNQPQPLEQA